MQGSRGDHACAFASAASAAICAARRSRPPHTGGNSSGLSRRQRGATCSRNCSRSAPGFSGLELSHGVKISSEGSPRAIHPECPWMRAEPPGIGLLQLPLGRLQRVRCGQSARVVHEAHELGVLLDRGGAGRDYLACGGVEGDAVRTRVLRRPDSDLAPIPAFGFVEVQRTFTSSSEFAQGAQVRQGRP